ncbi:NAD-dependent deacylase [Pedobacter sp. HMF7647]|uniref:NAD-dependent protein deacylase n=1 Tax=Hufsiella arboris TaxID=2695275 RepID=A0A7K1Y9H1_9SPHI|nr:NAD-dependent deacylase [Hufsiella arboris]MXV50698.1 NAD-dependent deacylase [Hufsiella arboris]
MNIVVLTGAGISAESGLKTFRDADGLWEGYNVYDVATPEAWARDPEMVQEFYNMRRKSVLEAEPNAAHFALAELEKSHQVTIITQNIDDLHERAGSTNIVHLHGIITRSQSDMKAELTYPIDGWELKMGEKCELGSQLRPHVVWFGEAVPMIDKAALITSQADLLVIIGTSLQVYPAAGLANMAPPDAEIILIDPKAGEISTNGRYRAIGKKATEGVPELVNELITKD